MPTKRKKGGQIMMDELFDELAERLINETYQYLDELFDAIVNKLAEDFGKFAVETWYEVVFNKLDEKQQQQQKGGNAS